MNRMKRRGKDDWIVLGPAPHFATCTRCGQHVPMPELGISLDGFLAYCKYARFAHAGCKAEGAE